MHRVRPLQILLGAILLLAFGSCATPTLAKQPNIVWIIVEDMSANFGCYGETSIQTPNVDQLASEGVKFTNAIVTAPVCSTCRSAFITGMYQTSIGSHHHRSGRGKLKITLPADVVPVPKLFRDAGYHVNNLSTELFLLSADEAKSTRIKTAKTDYNFEFDKSIYHSTHWSNRDDDQPFFCQIQPRGGKLRGKGDADKWPTRARKVLGSNTPTTSVKLPPYLPNHPVIVEDWRQYLDAVRYTDWEVGQILQRLEESGDLQNTYVFFITDHGISHVRNKQFMYEGGVHIPFVVRGPGLQPSTRTDVIEHIDLGATSLALAGLEIPPVMQSRDILASDYQPREFAFSARDRCDETVDRMRCVRSERFKYIRNFLPERPYLQPNRYKDNKPIVKTMRQLFADGLLNPAQARIMAASRPEEELYDLHADPFELNNLAGQPEFAEVQNSMRTALADWIKHTGDRGMQAEGAMYDSDMQAYFKGDTTSPMGRQLMANIALMKQWAADGK